MTISEKVGLRIKNRRELLNMSTTQVAQKLNIHRQSINRIERGSNSVGIDLLYRVAQVLDTNIGALVD